MASIRGSSLFRQAFLIWICDDINLDWRDYVIEDPLLQADPFEAKPRLGWEPPVAFRDLVRIMMDADLEAAGLSAPGHGTRCLTDGRLEWLRKP